MCWKKRLNAYLTIRDNVVFRIMPFEMLGMFDAVLSAGCYQGICAEITGAGNEDYPKGKVHAQGYAIDVAVKNIPDIKRFVLYLNEFLGLLNPHYKVLYGDDAHLDHIHIGFSWYWAKKI